MMEADFRVRDRKKALQIITYSSLAGLIMTIVAWNAGRALH
ncbi:MAG TPA: hypothetical protein VF514_08730 [Bacteroidota bacterium]